MYLRGSSFKSLIATIVLDNQAQQRPGDRYFLFSRSGKVIGFGLPYPLDPRKTSVIKPVGLGDPTKSGFRDVVQGDDRGDRWDLSAVICEARATAVAGNISVPGESIKTTHRCHPL